VPRRRFARTRRPVVRRSVAVMAALVIASLTVLTGCTTVPLLSIASTGDSVTRGFDACGLLSDCPAVSYATGSKASSDSLYRRLLATNPGLRGHEYNDAEVGARASDLYSEMSLAVWQKADVVTVLIGANDACTNTVGQMTPVASFRASIDEAFGLFFSNRPGARIVLSSIPDIYRVWQVGHTNSRARLIWQAAGLCPSMLDNAGSSAPADQLRRVMVSLQIAKYNAALASVCAAYRGCRWDGGALNRFQFTAADLSSFDFFHPSPQGHRALAALAWNAYWSRK
jgi:lysophospholipase L1-like esterase